MDAWSQRLGLPELASFEAQNPSDKPTLVIVAPDFAPHPAFSYQPTVLGPNGPVSYTPVAQGEVPLVRGASNPTKVHAFFFSLQRSI